MFREMALGLWIAAALISGELPPAQQIEWAALEGCPAQAAVAEATNQYLGGRALAEFPRAVIAQAWVIADTAGFRLRLTITVDGVREHHQLRAVDCDQLGRDAALLIASAVDPFALGPPTPAPSERQLSQTTVIVQRPRTSPNKAVATSADPSEPAPSPTLRPAQPRPPAVALEPPASPPKREPKREPKPPVTGTLAVAGLGVAGLFPQIGGGVELEGGLQRGLFRWQLASAGWFGGSFRAPASDVGGNLSAVSGATGFCIAPRWGTVRFSACAVAGAGAVLATSINTQTAQTLARAWVFAGPDLRVTWSPRQRPRLGLFLGIAALPALVRPGWSISDPDARYRVPPVLGLLRAGIELGRLGGVAK